MNSSWSSPDDEIEELEELKELEEFEKFERCVSKVKDNKTGISRVNSVCCIRISRNWSMKSQVTIASIILFLTIFTLLVSVTALNVSLVGGIMKDSQNQLYVSVAQKLLIVVSNRFKRLVNTHFDAVNADTEKFQKIYLIVSQEQKISPNGFLDTHNSNLTLFQMGSLNSWVCYNAYSNKTNPILNESENQGFMDTIIQYNQIYPLYRNQNYTYLAPSNYGAFWTQQQLLYLYPCNYLGLPYRPQNRSWYIEMRDLDNKNRQINKIYISSHVTKPFISKEFFNQKDYDTKDTAISVLKILFDKNYNFQGTTGSTIYISEFEELFKLQFMNFSALLVNYDGSLLISPYFDNKLEGISLNLLFSNETITGFDLQDWQQVTNLALGKQISHNCSLLSLRSVFNLLCRWNKLKQKRELIYATHLKKLNYYIVILLDEENLLRQFLAQEQEIQDNLIQTSIIFFAEVIAVFMFLLALVITIFGIIFKPLHNMITYCQYINEKNTTIFNKKKTEQINILNIISYGVFYPITKSFQSLTGKLFGLKIERYYMCQEIESMEYPKKERLKLNLDSQILQLEDTNQNINLTHESKRSYQIHQLDLYKLNEISQTSGEFKAIYHQRLLQTKQDKQVKILQAQLQTNGSVSQEKLNQLIFQYYKKI